MSLGASLVTCMLTAVVLVMLKRRKDTCIYVHGVCVCVCVEGGRGEWCCGARVCSCVCLLFFFFFFSLILSHVHCDALSQSAVATPYIGIEQEKNRGLYVGYRERAHKM